MWRGLSFPTGRPVAPELRVPAQRRARSSRSSRRSRDAPSRSVSSRLAKQKRITLWSVPSRWNADSGIVATPNSHDEALGERGGRLVADPPVARELEVAAGAGQQVERGPGEQFAEQVALALEERRQRLVARRILQERGQAVLDRAVDGEHRELVDAADLGGERRGRQRVAHLPAGGVEGLAERADDDAARRQLVVARQAFVPRAVVDHVLVDLVADHDDRRVPDDRRELVEIGSGQHAGAGVVRRVEQDEPRSRRDRGADRVPVDPVIRERQRQRHRGGAGELHRRHVAVVRRLEDDDLVAGMRERLDGREDRLRRAGRHGDLVDRVVAAPVQPQDLGRDRLAQRRHARHRRILVVPGAHRRGDEVDQRRVDRIVGKALAEVDGAVLLGERRHHAEDRGARGGQLRTNRDEGGRRHGRIGGRRARTARGARPPHRQNGDYARRAGTGPAPVPLASQRGRARVPTGQAPPRPRGRCRRRRRVRYNGRRPPPFTARCTRRSNRR